MNEAVLITKQNYKKWQENEDYGDEGGGDGMMVVTMVKTMVRANGKNLLEKIKPSRNSWHMNTSIFAACQKKKKKKKKKEKQEEEEARVDEGHKLKDNRYPLTTSRPKKSGP